MNRWIRRLLGTFLSLALGATQALAVALGNLEVTSHLGEPFHAEAPLLLAKGERISGVFVELASPSEYRILEVYRDPALNVIRSDIKTDQRGARVELTSDSAIEAPFFNLILKVRHGHATHFKKFPVFLDLPDVRPAAARALPVVSAVRSKTGAGTEAAPVAVEAGAPEKKAGEAPGGAPVFKPYDGWARIGRYGPMVYGDTISTVARRLRVDDRYTMAQVMMALFYKNRDKFDHDNINLIKAGTYLNVPRASEVEALVPAKARQLLAEQNRAWRRLKQQPRYAAVAEAQKNRYKPRVRVGKAAEGVAAGPVRGGETRAPVAGVRKAASAPASEPAGQATKHPPTNEERATGQGGEAVARVKELEQQNAALQRKLKETEAKVEAMSAKLASADVTAANARIKKLELRLARLQAELDRQRQAREAAGGVPEWATYGLAGLVVVLLAVVGWLLSRMRRMSVPAVADMAAPMAGGEGATATPAEAAGAFAEVQEFEEVGTVEAAAAGGEAADEATRQMDAEESRDAFTDSVPDLTESDTAEMEPFQEAVEEEPDPNVDYLAEADVYLRYGMEDEALRQIRLAIRQRPDNAQAHARLVQTLEASGDEAAAAEAVEAAREALSGDALQIFEDALAAGGGEGQESDGEEVDLGDTLPPTGVEALDFAEAGEAGSGGETDQAAPDEEQETLVLGEEAERAAAEAGTEAETLADLDLDFGDMETASGSADAAEGEAVGLKETPGDEAMADEPTLTEAVELSDETTIGREESEAEQDAVATETEDAPQDESSEQPALGDEGVLDMTELDMGDLDWDAATTLEETAQPSGTGETAGTEDVPVTTGADLDLSDIRIPEVEEADEPEEHASVGIETSDLEKTVAIDWSDDTEALEELTGGMDPTGTAASKPEEAGEETSSAGKPAEQDSAAGMLDIGLDEIDLDAASPDASGASDLDDFTSTVQMTVESDSEEEPEDIGLESVELEAMTDLDLASEGDEATASSAETGTEDHAGEAEDAGEAMSGNEDDDVAVTPEPEQADITMELDTLLTELNLDGETSPMPENLDADRVKSLLSEAEASIGQGDGARARELLSEAEGILDDAHREWFETLKQKVDAL